MTGKKAATTSVLVVAALLIAGCGDGAEGDHQVHSPSQTSAPTPKELVGDWGGLLAQEGLPQFRVAVQFKRNALSVVAYTGIDCGGVWILDGVLESNPPIYLFTEEIDQGAGGACEGSGRVSLHPTESYVDPEVNPRPYGHLRYEFEGGGVRSSGTLTPINALELSEIFDEAGVELPD